MKLTVAWDEDLTDTLKYHVADFRASEVQVWLRFEASDEFEHGIWVKVDSLRIGGNVPKPLALTRLGTTDIYTGTMKVTAPSRGSAHSWSGIGGVVARIFARRSTRITIISKNAPVSSANESSSEETPLDDIELASAKVLVVSRSAQAIAITLTVLSTATYVLFLAPYLKQVRFENFLEGLPEFTATAIVTLVVGFAARMANEFDMPMWGLVHKPLRALGALLLSFGVLLAANRAFVRITNRSGAAYSAKENDAFRIEPHSTVIVPRWPRPAILDDLSKDEGPLESGGVRFHALKGTGTSDEWLTEKYFFGRHYYLDCYADDRFKGSKYMDDGCKTIPLFEHGIPVESSTSPCSFLAASSIKAFPGPVSEWFSRATLIWNRTGKPMDVFWSTADENVARVKGDLVSISAHCDPKQAFLFPERPFLSFRAQGLELGSVDCISNSSVSFDAYELSVGGVCKSASNTWSTFRPTAESCDRVFLLFVNPPDSPPEVPVVNFQTRVAAGKPFIVKAQQTLLQRFLKVAVHVDMGDDIELANSFIPEAPTPGAQATNTDVDQKDKQPTVTFFPWRVKGRVLGAQVGSTCSDSMQGKGFKRGSASPSDVWLPLDPSKMEKEHVCVQVGKQQKWVDALVRGDEISVPPAACPLPSPTPCRVTVPPPEYAHCPGYCGN